MLCRNLLRLLSIPRLSILSQIGFTGRQTKCTKRIAGKAAQQTENQQLTTERQILARKTKCDLLGLYRDLTASDGPGTWI